PDWMISKIEWLCFLLLLSPMVYFITMVFREKGLGLYNDASIYKWFVFGLFIVMCTVFVKKLYMFYIQQNQSTYSLYYGTNFLLFLAVLFMLVGIAGTLTELYWLGGLLEVIHGRHAPHIFQWIQKSGNLFVLSIFGAAFSTILGLFFTIRAARMESAAKDILLDS
ncbi:hypothetical protein ACFL6L_03865, partial [candidate division KSB1 bacterium]